MNYADYKLVLTFRESELADARATLKAVADRLTAELKPATPAFSGLTPDVVKFHPDYRAARLVVDAAFDKVREWNGEHAKTFVDEIKADRDARRAAKLQGNQ